MTKSHSNAATQTQQPLLYSVAGTAIVAVVLTVLFYFDLDKQVLTFIEWIKGRGATAAIIFVFVMAAVVVLLLPGVLFTCGAGFVFGVVKGTLYVTIGTTLGATLAFIIARYAFGERAATFIRSRSTIRHLSDSMSKEGLRVVLFSRLIPFFPAKLANYLFGLTSVRLRDFIIGTLVGIIPFSLHNVYLGSITADLVALGSQPTQRSPAEWAAYGVGLVLIVVAVHSLGRFARRALDRGAQSEHNSDKRDTAMQHSKEEESS